MLIAAASLINLFVVVDSVLIAQAMSVTSPRALLEENLPTLLAGWENDKKKLSNFPFYLLECESFVRFLEK